MDSTKQASNKTMVQELTTANIENNKCEKSTAKSTAISRFREVTPDTNATAQLRKKMSPSAKYVSGMDGTQKKITEHFKIADLGMDKSKFHQLTRKSTYQRSSSLPNSDIDTKTITAAELMEKTDFKAIVNKACNALEVCPTKRSKLENNARQSIEDDRCHSLP